VKFIQQAIFLLTVLFFVSTSWAMDDTTGVVTDVVIEVQEPRPNQLRQILYSTPSRRDCFNEILRACPLCLCGVGSFLMGLMLGSMHDELAAASGGAIKRLKGGSPFETLYKHKYH